MPCAYLLGMVMQQAVHPRPFEVIRAQINAAAYRDNLVF
jgi:hypothetical protein